jgi:hypothetical protein
VVKEKGLLGWAFVVSSVLPVWCAVAYSGTHVPIDVFACVDEPASEVKMKGTLIIEDAASKQSSATHMRRHFR